MPYCANRFLAIAVLPKPVSEQISCIGLRPLATESISVSAVCMSAQTMLVRMSYGRWIMAPFSSCEQQPAGFPSCR